jgi:NAD-dependent deacetylase
VKQNIVFFSGAGMSAESGIGTFRDSNGLWERYSIEEVATPEAWKKNPNLVTDFYNQRRKQIMEVSPNASHFYISSLESDFNVSVVTQNIDDLHERAGSSNVLHLHGNIRLAKSSGPNAESKYYPIDGWELTEKDVCPDGYRLRPHVVWFGESVPAYELAIPIIEKADIMVVVGTSLQVYPAAGLIHYSRNDAQKIVIDPKIDQFDLPKGFVKISETAVNGISKLDELLKNR